MQDGGGVALRGAAAPAGSGVSRPRDQRAWRLWAAGGNRSAESAAGTGKASGAGPGGRRVTSQKRPLGLSPLAAAGGVVDPARGVQGDGLGLSRGWAVAAEGQIDPQPPSLFLGVSATERAWGRGALWRENLSPLPW